MLIAEILIGRYWFLLGIAIVSTISLVAIAYAISKMLSIESLEAYARSEIAHMFLSVIILILITFAAEAFNSGADRYARLILAADPLSSVVCTNTEPCQVSLAKNYLGIIFNSSKQMAGQIIWINSTFMFLSDIGVGLRLTIIPMSDLSIKPFAALSMVSDALLIAIDILYKMMIALRFQEYLLDIIWQTIFPIFLIFGFFLRNFFLTRRLGGLMIAIAVGFYFVYPFMYALSGYILIGYSGRTLNPLNIDRLGLINPFEIGGGGNITRESMPTPESLFEIEPTRINLVGEQSQPTMEGYLRILRSLIQHILEIFRSLVDVPHAFLRTYRGSAWIIGEGGVFESVARMMIFSLFMPFVAIMSTIASIKILSPLLGGDVEIAGLTRLI
ncbi:MAG: hypothetical protein QXW70_01555 [Candidatus Anstonellales archaeon]